VQCDLYLKTFCLQVFEATQGGLQGVYQKSYRDLAATPLGLCCSIPKARSTVKWAVTSRLVTSREFVSSEGQRANRYEIDWDGVQSYKLGTRGPTRTLDPKDQGGDLSDHPHASKDQGGDLSNHPHASKDQGGDLSNHPLLKGSHDFLDDDDKFVVVVPEEARAGIVAEAVRLYRSVAGPNRRAAPKDAQLMLHVALMAEFRLGSEWARHAEMKTRAKRPNDRLAYFVRCLKNGLYELARVCSENRVHYQWNLYRDVTSGLAGAMVGAFSAQLARQVNEETAANAVASPPEERDHMRAAVRGSLAKLKNS
jgi:hypothetical protein